MAGNLEDEDWELQQAIALSLADTGQGSSLSGGAGPSNAACTPGASKRSLPSAPGSRGAAEPEEAAAAERPGGKGKGKRRKAAKGPGFNPSPEEAAACFRQLSAGGRVTRHSLLAAARTLALDIDDDRAVLMMEVALQKVLGRAAAGSGPAPASLSFDEFKEVVAHFSAA